MELYLIFVSIAIRVYIYVSLPMVTYSPGLSYPDSLRNHFLEYLWNNTLLPPLSYVLHAIPVFTLGVEGNTAHYGFLMLTYVLDCLAVLCIYRTSLLLGVRRVIGFMISMLYSVALIPFEIWRSNYLSDHYDHHTIALTALFAFACIRLLKSPIWSSVIMLTVASSLLILQSSVATYVVPVVLLVVILCLPFYVDRKLSNFYSQIATMVSIVLLSIAVLIGHHAIVSGQASPSTKGGLALMMFVQRTLDNDSQQVRQQLIESGAPQWYLWCYDHAKPPMSPGEDSYKPWVLLSQAFGTCMSWGKEPGVTGTPWPFNYDDLLEVLRTSGRPDLAIIVEKDRYDAYYRQYLLQGFSPEASPRWIGIYGQVSSKAALHLLFARPHTYLRGIAWHHNQLFWRLGPNFLARVAGDLKTCEYRLRGALYKFNRFVFSIFLRIPYLATPIAMLGIASIYFMPNVLVLNKTARVLKMKLLECAVLATAVYAMALLFSGAVSVENDRYFIQVTPYLMILLGVLLRDGGALLEVARWGKRVGSDI